MTLAVLLSTTSVVPLWILIVGVMLAAGVTPLATWAVSKLRSQMARRFLLAFAVAVVLSLTLGVGTAQAVVFRCDSDWWWLWIC